MKLTTEKILPLSILATSGLIIIAGIFAYNSMTATNTSEEEYQILSQQVTEIETLKSRWSHEASQNDLTYLTTHPNLTKNEKRGGSVYLEFTNLSANEFSRISNKLLNSTLIIKKMTLKRNNGSRGIILVEFES